MPVLCQGFGWLAQRHSVASIRSRPPEPYLPRTLGSSHVEKQKDTANSPDRHLEKVPDRNRGGDQERIHHRHLLRPDKGNPRKRRPHQPTSHRRNHHWKSSAQLGMGRTSRRRGSRRPPRSHTNQRPLLS